MSLNLLTKILLWVFVNLLVLGAVLYFIFDLNFRFAPHSPLMGAPDERLEIIASLISAESARKTRAERDEIVKRFSEQYEVEFTIFDNNGNQLGGKDIELPPKVKRALSRPFRPPAGMPRLKNRPSGGFPNDDFPKPPPGFQIRIERTTSPTMYWAISRIPIIEKGQPVRVKASVVAYSDSFTGNGLFYNPKPWIFTILIIVGLTAIIWFPFVRNLNKSISQLTNATEQIADENFSVRVDEKRKDEIGRLGKSVNHLAKRLSGFVQGQKRFLGDISHELNSPLARMTWALSILETRTNKEDQKYIEDVREEVELMAKLVRELLSYSKAGIKGTEVRLENINVLQLTEEVVEREKFHKSNVEIDIDKKLIIRANRNLLSRAISNVLQNAIRYAGDKEKIAIRAESKKDNVILRIIDQGEGVPEAELDRLFDPLYRVEKDRARQTGGTGLGLAIVKTCIEACDGKVFAKNLSPKGFEIKFVLNSANSKNSKPIAEIKYL